MLRYMLDTNICIYVTKNYPDRLRERFDEVAEQLCISAITFAELSYGVAKSARRSANLEALEQFVGRIDVLPFDAGAATHYGDIRAELERVGQPAGGNDMLIGGHARSEGLILVTNNTREFLRMPGLRIENWVEGE